VPRVFEEQTVLVVEEGLGKVVLFPATDPSRKPADGGVARLDLTTFAAIASP